MSQTPPEDTPLEILLTHLEWNLKHLENISRNENTEYYRKASLQRYGFTFESALRCIRAWASLQDRSCATPEECFELAAEMGWLDPEFNWRELVSDFRSMTPESMDQVAPALHQKLAANILQLKSLHQQLASLA